MEYVGTFLAGAVVGGLLTWLWISASNHWKQGRGMMSEPQKAKEKMKEEAKKSSEKAVQGRQKVRSACLLYLALVILVFFVFLLLRTIII